MSVLRPGDVRPLHSSYRAERIDHGSDEDERDDQRKKKKVSYHGRSWSESDEDLPVQPTIAVVEKEERKKRAVYADQALLERAEKLLVNFVSIEEKVAQLCFYHTDAFYDSAVQSHVELLIQKYQIGGLLFSKGEFRRQSYLIECYQKMAKFPLAIGNDFLHGLSFYFQEGIPTDSLEKMNERRYCDLGKAVVSQNRKLGVHFQFDCERHLDAAVQRIELRVSQARAFRNGIREAGGIVAREKKVKEKMNKKADSLPDQMPFSHFLSPGNKVQEAHSMRSLSFVDFTTVDSNFREQLIVAFHECYDAFLLKEGIEEAISILAAEVRLGKISESELDRRLLKILLHKMVLFNL